MYPSSGMKYIRAIMILYTLARIKEFKMATYGLSNKKIILSYHNYKKTWNEAYEVCRSQGGTLYIEDSQERTDSLNKCKQNWGSSDDVWIGLYYPSFGTNGRYIWTDCVPLSATYDRFESDEHKNTKEKKCVSSGDHRWKSEKCSHEKKFVCGADCTFNPTTLSTSAAYISLCETDCIRQEDWDYRVFDNYQHIGNVPVGNCTSYMNNATPNTTSAAATTTRAPSTIATTAQSSTTTIGSATTTAASSSSSSSSTATSKTTTAAQSSTTTTIESSTTTTASPSTTRTTEQSTTTTAVPLSTTTTPATATTTTAAPSSTTTKTTKPSSTSTVAPSSTMTTTAPATTTTAAPSSTMTTIKPATATTAERTASAFTTSASANINSTPCNCQCSDLSTLFGNNTADPDWKNLTVEEKVKLLVTRLTVEKSNLSSFVRKKTCARDDRAVSVYTGYIAISIISIIFGLIIVSDGINFLKYLAKKKKHSPDNVSMHRMEESTV